MYTVEASQSSTHVQNYPGTSSRINNEFPLWATNKTAFVLLIVFIIIFTIVTVSLIIFFLRTPNNKLITDNDSPIIEIEEDETIAVQTFVEQNKDFILPQKYENFYEFSPDNLSIEFQNSMENFISGEKKVSINYPYDWDIEKDDLVLVNFVSPIESGNTAVFNIVEETKVNTEISLESYASIVQKQLKEIFPEFETLGLKEIEINDQKGLILYYYSTNENYDFAGFQIYIKKSNDFYVLGFGSNIEGFNQHLETALMMASTFELK